jgi:hypothetical protein
MELFGQAFGKWNVLRRVASGRAASWECRCACGIIKTVSQRTLVQGTSRSCGCDWKKVFPGSKFGRLTVIEVAESGAKRKPAKWRCACDCGAIIVTKSGNLTMGDTESCGCIRVRNAEEMAIHLLANRTIDSNGCWNWTGGLTSAGYGRVHFITRNVGVHRLAAHLWLGMSMDSEEFVCHRCDNPKCFNPEHLFLGTQKDNMQDCSRKHRTRRYKVVACKYGHPYTEANTRLNGAGSRYCATCCTVRNHAKRKTSTRAVLSGI